MKKKSLLVVFSKAPYDGLTIKEAMDATLATTIFDIPVSVLLIDEGVFILKSPQNASLIGAKCLEKPLSAFELYGVEKVLVDKTSLLERGISMDEPWIDVQYLDHSRIMDLWSEYDCVLNF